jgi:aryl-alcohol dehydrogenase-like predicted oxidoreductase
MPRFSAENWPTNLVLVDAFNAIATEQGVTPAQLSLAWVLSRAPHIVVIPGTASIPHLEENIARKDWIIPSEVAARIDALFTPEAPAGPRYVPAAQATVSTEEFA